MYGWNNCVLFFVPYERYHFGDAIWLDIILDWRWLQIIAIFIYFYKINYSNSWDFKTMSYWILKFERIHFRPLSPCSERIIPLKFYSYVSERVALTRCDRTQRDWMWSLHSFGVECDCSSGWRCFTCLTIFVGLPWMLICRSCCSPWTPRRLVKQLHCPVRTLALCSNIIIHSWHCLTHG